MIFLIYDFEGPCSFDEVFFPLRSASTSEAIGSCFKTSFGGHTRFSDVNDVCLDSYATGSSRSSFSKRDSEYGLLMGSFDFLNMRTTTERYHKNKLIIKFAISQQFGSLLV